MSADVAKINAAAAALDFVREGMTLGLGTGSTAAHFVRLLGERARKGLSVTGVATSAATEQLARECGVAMTSIDHVSKLDIAIDGADEIDPHLNLIKGAGAALLREKIVASIADHFIVIADESKVVERLGACALPIEVTAFGFTHAARRAFEALRACGCGGTDVALREAGGKPLITDNGNFILDARAVSIPDPEGLAARLASIPGIVDHGLFLGMARTAIIGTARGARFIEAAAA